MMTMWERYQNDPAFNRLVDFILSVLMEGQFTPTELREAAMLAQIKHEELRPRPTVFTKDDIMRGGV